MRPRSHGLITLAATVAVGAAATTGASETGADPTPQCPALLAIGVQGPGEAAADTALDTDSGFLGQILRPIATGTEGAVERVYVRFTPEAHGVDAHNEGQTPYERSVAAATNEVNRVTTEFGARCAHGHIAVLGNSHGAHVASQFAQLAGRGAAGIAADRVAAVVLFGDPTRAANTPPLPSTSGRIVPTGVPGTSGEAVAALTGLIQQPTTGAGIGATENRQERGYGSLTGRVASFCVAGDLSCDTPEGAPILKAVDNILGSVADAGGDPLRALASLTQALAFTAIKTATSVVNEDVSGTSLASVSLSSQTSLAARVAEASDPRTPLNIDEVFKAVLKIGTIAVNAVTTVAKTVLTPTNIAEIAAAGLSNPAAGLAVLGTKLAAALPQLVPPTTASRLVGQAFTALTSTVTDNAGLIDTANWVRYSDALTSRGSYQNDPVTATGQSPVAYTIAWLQALVRDLATEATSASTSPAPTSTTSPRPSPTISSAPPATTTSTSSR